MAQITSGASQVFEAGAASSQKVVGYASGKNWVVRYAFQTGGEGAGSVSWAVRLNSLAGGSQTAGLSWAITADANSHANANASGGYGSHGAVAITADGTGYLTFSGSAELLLLPNTLYYLWLFPTTTTYGYFYLTSMETASITVSGGAGLAGIYEGSGFGAYRIGIFNGAGWDFYLPYLFDGSGWVLW